MVPGSARVVVYPGLTLGFTLLNLLSVRTWGEAEYWFASIKVAAIVAFLCLGAAAILGLWPNVAGASRISRLTEASCLMVSHLCSRARWRRRGSISAPKS